jgi:uroporphyrin-III C-methyltransferase/precorrin-2 dehydrogenase/sirohydrochlorin ferrochelatase
MQTLPVFLDVQGQRCLLVGTGDVADRKRRLLAAAGADIHNVDNSSFAEHLLDGVALVVAASTDEALNARVSHAARARHIPVNVVDQPALCSFIFPAVVERGPVTVAVSSGGALPVLARLLRARLETLLPPSLGEFATRAASFCQQVRQQLPEMRQRLRFWDGLLQQHVISGGSDLQALGDERAFGQQLAAFLAGEQRGRITVVGTGPGDPDLLTFKALRCLQGCDLLVYGDNVSPAIVNLARRDAQRLVLQETADVAMRLQSEAAQGADIAWLLPGDPLSWREVPLLLAGWQAAGVTCNVVPGIIDQNGVFTDGV